MWPSLHDPGLCELSHLDLPAPIATSCWSLHIPDNPDRPPLRRMPDDLQAALGTIPSDETSRLGSCPWNPQSIYS